MYGSIALPWLGQVHIEKNYAFAEFVTPEDATAALAFDGIMLHGTVLKLKRPKDYVQPVVSLTLALFHVSWRFQV